MIKCNECGAVVPDGARFCTECGSPLNITPEEAWGDFADASRGAGWETETQAQQAAWDATLNQEPQNPWEAAPDQEQQNPWEAGSNQGQQAAWGAAPNQGQQAGWNQTPNQGSFYGNPQMPTGQVGQKNKIAAGLLAILLGSLGVHKFYLGYTSTGVIMLLVTIFGAIVFGLGPLIMGIISLVEGIIYLTKSDYDFYETYEAGQKKWF